MAAQDKVNVIMLKRVAGIGKEGEIVTVSHTQAKNYLIPKGIAKLATDDLIKRKEEKTKKQQDNARYLLEERHKIAETLHQKTVNFELPGVGKKVFGGIQEKDIIEAIRKSFGVELEKKHVLLPEGHHLKQAGVHDIKINLWSDVYIKMQVDIKTKWQ